MFRFRSLRGRFQRYELSGDEPMFAQGRRILPTGASPLVVDVHQHHQAKAPLRDCDDSLGIHSHVLLSIGGLITVSERFPSLCGFDDAANGIHNDHGVLAPGNHILVRGSLNREMHTV